MSQRNSILDLLREERDHHLAEAAKRDAALRAMAAAGPEAPPTNADSGSLGEAAERLMKIGVPVQPAWLAKQLGVSYQRLYGALRHGAQTGRFKRQGKKWVRVA